MNSSYQVKGMTCGHCAASVTAEVSRLPGVSDVRVDLPTGTVTVTCAQPVEYERLKAAVNDAGYEVIG